MVPACELPVPASYAVDAARHQQVVLAAGRGRHSSHSIVSRWQFADGCWTQVARVKARNGARGWHPKPWDYSYYSPIGTFGLTDAGGRLPKPAGSRLPYDHDRRGFVGPAGRSWIFDYVVAVNFNRVPGRSPLNMFRPDPSINDGGIWLHVKSGLPTRGCIAVSRDEMRATLRWLDPQARPIIIMGPRGLVTRG